MEECRSIFPKALISTKPRITIDNKQPYRGECSFFAGLSIAALVKIARPGKTPHGPRLCKNRSKYRGLYHEQAGEIRTMFVLPVAGHLDPSAFDR